MAALGYKQRFRSPLRDGELGSVSGQLSPEGNDHRQEHQVKRTGFEVGGFQRGGWSQEHRMLIAHWWAW